MAGRGAGDSRVRGGLVVGCFDGGGGGSGMSDDEVVSIDKERMGIKGDAM